MSSLLSELKSTLLETLSCLLADMDSVVEELENHHLSFECINERVSKLVDFSDDVQQCVCDLVDHLESHSTNDHVPHLVEDSQAEEDEC